MISPPSIALQPNYTRSIPARRLAVLTAMSDEDLMEQFQTGVVDAFNILMSRHAERLLRYLYGFMHDVMLCEDLLQETFMRVHRNRFSYRRIARFSTWLYTIAGNLARSEYRRRKRQRTYSLQSVNNNNETYELPLPDESFIPDREAERMLQHQYIQAALGRISPTFREVVILRDVQELSYEEIAAITGLPMGTVKSRINRGRSKLQGLLREIYQTQPA